MTEADETFFVTLSNPNDARFGDSKGVATLKNATAVQPLSASAVSTTLAQTSSAGGTWFMSNLVTSSSNDLNGTKKAPLTTTSASTVLSTTSKGLI